jgi:hypothetical protein
MMKRKLFGLFFVLLFVSIIVIAWIWWNAPARVEMARYVPAETLVYFEANNLPQILRAYTESAAWRALAPQYGIKNDYGKFGWWSEFLATANLGSSDAVVFGRSQAAIAVFGFDASENDAESLKIKPRYAVVLETKTSAATAQNFIDRRIGELARERFGKTSIEKQKRDNAAWTIFRAMNDEQRKIFAVARGSVIIFGNDESSIQTCLEAQNGARKSLAESPQLDEMRRRVRSEDGFVFGLVTSEGVKILSRFGAVLFASQAIEEPAALSLIAQSLPPMLEKSVNGIGWSARPIEGKIEDRYFVALPADLTARFREAFAVSTNDSSRAAEFLPPDAHSVTVYNLRNAGAAWRALILGLSAKLDVLGSAAMAQTAGKLLEPYGVARANDFLSGAGDSIVTARLSEEENETVAVVKVADENKMKASLKTGDPERATEFVEGALLLGEKDDVEKCLTAKRSRNLSSAPLWREFERAQETTEEKPFVKTVARDTTSAIQFLRIFNMEKNASPTFDAGDSWAFSTAETRLGENGFERRSRSAFGLFGTLATTFAEAN